MEKKSNEKKKKIGEVEFRIKKGYKKNWEEF
jgi:hypothetical protein